MISFLFWNLYGRGGGDREQRTAALEATICRLAARREIDVLLFTECGIASAALVHALNKQGVGTYYEVESKSRRIRMFSRLPGDPWADKFNDGTSNRLTIQLLRLDTAPSILVACLHFHDRQSLATESGRAGVAQDIADRIKKDEDDVGHRRTLLVGDFNMNPFEQGMVSARGLHAVMTRRLAKTVQRLKRRTEHPCFYNPMWGFFGDRSPGAPGTYFFSSSLDTSLTFWNIYDQVLLRPELMDSLVEIEILDTDGQESFLTKEGRPRKRLSDHLPVYFVLSL